MQKRFLCLSLGMALVSGPTLLASCASPVAPKEEAKEVGPAVLADRTLPPDSQNPFSFDVSPRSLQNVQEREGETSFSIGANFNDHSGPYWYTASTTSLDYADGTDVVVAVIDNGFQGNDEPYMPYAITYKAEWTWNTARDVSSFKGETDTDKPWHGRQMASLVFADWGDNKGVIGAAPDAQPLLIHSSDYYWDIKEAIDTARNNNAKVINMSIYGGWSGLWSWITSSVTAAYNENRIMVAITGNDGYATGVYPAAYPEVMGIAALDRSGNNADSGDWGSGGSNTSNADLWAPGTAVAVAADPNNWRDGAGGTSNANWGRCFKRVNGTSPAAPQVTGVIAALVERGYLANANTTSAISFLRTWSYGPSDGYAAGRSLNAIYALF